MLQAFVEDEGYARVPVFTMPEHIQSWVDG